MTKLSLRVVIALLALVIATNACSKSPTAPDPIQPGPVVVNPPPAVSSLELEATAPPPGTTLRATIVLPSGLNSGDEVVANVKYAISAEDLAKITRDGDALVVLACLSLDGEEPIKDPANGYTAAGACGGSPVSTSNYSGRAGATIGLRRRVSDATQTDYLILYMKARHGSGQGQTERVVLKRVVSVTFRWL